MSNAPKPRADIYSLVHKGLRAALFDTLTRIGRMDPHDEADVARSLGSLSDLLVLLRSHLHHEDRVVHPALEARMPGASAVTAHDHVEHAHALELLEGDARALRLARPDERDLAAARLYRSLSLVVADNLRHMHEEETRNHEALWATHTDEELHALTQAIVSAIPPETMLLFHRFMLPAMTPGERAGMLGAMRAGMPAAVYEAVMARLAPVLDEARAA